MKRLSAVLTLFACAALAACASASRESKEEGDEKDEAKVAVVDVPAAVRHAAEAAVPGIVITKAAKETDEGKEYYEVSGTVAGSKVDVLVTPEGEVVEVERAMALDSVPPAVRAAAEKKLPGFVAERAESSTMKDRTTIELRGKVSGKVYEIALSESGEVLEVED